jgi:hypothetical protein
MKLSTLLRPILEMFGLGYDHDAAMEDFYLAREEAMGDLLDERAID